MLLLLPLLLLLHYEESREVFKIAIIGTLALPASGVRAAESELWAIIHFFFFPSSPFNHSVMG